MEGGKFSGGSWGISDTRSKTINSIEPSEEARGISASARPEKTIPNNDLVGPTLYKEITTKVLIFLLRSV